MEVYRPLLGAEYHPAREHIIMKGSEAKRGPQTALKRFSPPLNWKRLEKQRTIKEMIPISIIAVALIASVHPKHGGSKMSLDQPGVYKENTGKKHKHRYLGSKDRHIKSGPDSPCLVGMPGLVNHRYQLYDHHFPVCKMGTIWNTNNSSQ